MPHGEEGREATLIVKAKTLLLKYVTLGVPLKLSFNLSNERLIYALTISDDSSQKSTIWSIAESEDEIDAIREIMGGSRFGLALFNEVGANSAFCLAKLIPTSSPVKPPSSLINLNEVDYEAFKGIAHGLMESLDGAMSNQTGWSTASIQCESDWKIIRNHFVTEMAISGLLDISHTKEGEHQELMALWLAGSLKPGNCFHSPQVPSGPRMREFTDLLLTSRYGAILIESKCLTILGRSKLPDRSKLRRDVASHIAKATSQLKGAIRSLRSDVAIRSKTGDTIDVERADTPHAIILVPDLELLNPDDYGIEFMKNFMEETRGYIHILDVAELLRMIQAAEIISEKTQFSAIEAFDYYLTERSEITFKRGTLCIEVLLRFAPS
ncbi:hypothetical protein [Xanthomonas campestris]|uniref:hypothetical protein n=1 Tax=Xanthomonas campestris TaxID=339 RepID=UPI0012907838|nr:hypothetical protein [Xanthomonas campestris]